MPNLEARSTGSQTASTAACYCWNGAEEGHWPRPVSRGLEADPLGLEEEWAEGPLQWALMQEVGSPPPEES